MSSTVSDETNVQDETNNDEFQVDVSAVRPAVDRALEILDVVNNSRWNRFPPAVDRALEILDERGEDVTVGRVVGTAFRVGSAGDHRFETYVRVARARIGDREDGQ